MGCYPKAWKWFGPLFLIAIIVLLLIGPERKVESPRLTVLSADAVTLIHNPRFITFTNRPVIERQYQGVRSWLNELKGRRVNLNLNARLDLIRWVNLYRSFDNVSEAVLVPWVFSEYYVATPASLTRGSSKPLPVSECKSIVEMVLHENGVVAIREGRLLKFVRSDWVKTNSHIAPGPANHP